jgi:hypothetical protein
MVLLNNRLRKLVLQFNVNVYLFNFSRIGLEIENNIIWHYRLTGILPEIRGNFI